MNLFEERNVFAPGNIEPVGITLEIWHTNGYRYIDEEGHFESPDTTWRQLKHALVETIHEFTPLYGDKELSQFVATQIAYR